MAIDHGIVCKKVVEVEDFNVPIQHIVAPMNA